MKLDLYIRNVHNNLNQQLIEYLNAIIQDTKENQILFNFYIIKKNDLNKMKKSHNLSKYPVLIDNNNSMIIDNMTDIAKYINTLLANKTGIETNKINKQRNSKYRDSLEDYFSDIKLDGRGQIIEVDKEENKTKDFFNKNLLKFNKIALMVTHNKDDIIDNKKILNL